MLGAATALCVDKTGTLTVNQMGVARLYTKGQTHDFSLRHKVPEAFHQIAEYAILASQPDPFDPMDRAIPNSARKRSGAPSTCMRVGKSSASIR